MAAAGVGSELTGAMSCRPALECMKVHVSAHVTSEHQVGLAGELGKWPGIQR